MTLISRLEAATGPDRELDAGIAKLVGVKHGPLDEMVGAWPLRRSDEQAPAYTGSLDAAMTLLPEGCAYQIRRNVSPDGDEAYCNAQVWPYEGLRRDDDEPDEPHCFGNHDADKPAIALCLAALKARGIGSGE